MNEEMTEQAPEIKKKPGPKPKISKTTKPSIISVDTTISNMLQWDSEGHLLSFDTTVEGFKTLSDDVVKELSFDNKIRYQYAKDFHAKEVGEDKADWKDQIVVTEQFASPTERTTVKDADPNSRYYISSMQKIGKHEREGYRLLSDNEKESIGLSGRKTIGTLGKEEMILMKTTKENAERLKKEKRQKNQRRKGNIEGSIHELGESLDINVKDLN